MSAHTTGPWSQDRYGHIFDGNGSEVLFRGVSILSSGAPERIEMAEANTRLIAAAPELLAALKALAWAFEVSIHDHQDSGSYNAALAAIAKAEAP